MDCYFVNDRWLAVHERHVEKGFLLCCEHSVYFPAYCLLRQNQRQGIKGKCQRQPPIYVSGELVQDDYFREPAFWFIPPLVQLTPRCCGMNSPEPFPD